MQELLNAIAHALNARHAMLGTAESCTGGMIAAACTDVAGSSSWFERGIVSYSNAAKTALLGVAPALIQAHGAVSHEVAQAMAQGLLARAPVDWVLAVTGIAGPGGGSADKPVGTVWLACASSAGYEQLWCEHFAGDRAAVRQRTVHAALSALLQALTATQAPA